MRVWRLPISAHPKKKQVYFYACSCEGDPGLRWLWRLTGRWLNEGFRRVSCLSYQRDFLSGVSPSACSVQTSCHLIKEQKKHWRARRRLLWWTTESNFCSLSRSWLTEISVVSGNTPGDFSFIWRVMFCSLVLTSGLIKDDSPVFIFPHCERGVVWNTYWHLAV